MNYHAKNWWRDEVEDNRLCNLELSEVSTVGCDDYVRKKIQTESLKDGLGQRSTIIIIH